MPALEDRKSYTFCLLVGVCTNFSKNNNVERDNVIC